MSDNLPPLGIQRVKVVAVSVTELERANRFYRDTLGLEPAFEGAEQVGWQLGQVILMLKAGSDVHAAGLAGSGGVTLASYVGISGVTDDLGILAGYLIASVPFLAAGIAKGGIASMDLSAAKAAPGVLAVINARNAGKLGKGKFNTAKLLGGPVIEHYHQALALVVAETFEQARAAAGRQG